MQPYCLELDTNQIKSLLAFMQSIDFVKLDSNLMDDVTATQIKSSLVTAIKKVENTSTINELNNILSAGA